MWIYMGKDIAVLTAVMQSHLYEESGCKVLKLVENNTAWKSKPSSSDVEMNWMIIWVAVAAAEHIVRSVIDICRIF